MVNQKQYSFECRKRNFFLKWDKAKRNCFFSSKANVRFPSIFGSPNDNNIFNHL